MSGALARLGRAWNRFWFPELPTLALGLFRPAFAACMALEVGDSWWTNVFAIEGGYHLPYLEWIPLLSEPTYRLFHYAQYPLILLFGVGLATRTAGSLLLVLQAWLFFGDQLSFRNHPYFFLLVLLLLILGPAGDAVSLSAVLRARRRGSSVREALLGGRRLGVFQRLLQVQACIVYVFAALHKISPAFLDGHVLRDHLSVPLRVNLDVLFFRILSPESVGRLHAALVSPVPMRVLSVATVVTEIGLPFALWSPRTRPAAIVAGVLLHAGIAVTMSIYAFSAAMIASYLFFVDPALLRRWAGDLLRRASRPAPAPR